ncbi:hypothetical protein JFL43_10620 [Viridibacillus sp. YIM B01967]|uniref:Uncharacterized protein n=1 Tax=Viridibacillus soli TaxID=2798301 RepID=A0ABS1H7B5_9BACL|nr:hypothetical protein [Viridibacillus soli]MBK3495296.1 hypothetical protein [Viridibacillus soli]
MDTLIGIEKMVIINGEEIKIKQLGLKHLFRFVSILKKAKIVGYFMQLMTDLNSVEEETEEEKRVKYLQVVFNLIFELVEAEGEIYEFIASIVGKKKEDVENMPLDAFVKVVEAVFTSKDLTDFFSAVQRVLSKQTDQKTV